MGTEFDELELPRNRPTDPDLGMTDRQLLESIERTVSAMCGDLRSLSATLDTAVEQWQSVGKRVTELEVRVGRLEVQRGNGSEHPGAGL